MGDLASAEERIEAADQQLAADESEEAASGRDLRVLRQQLSAMRLALVEARARLAEQEARLTSCPAEEEEAGKKQVGWWLGGGVCRANMASVAGNAGGHCCGVCQDGRVS